MKMRRLKRRQSGLSFISRPYKRLAVCVAKSGKAIKRCVIRNHRSMKWRVKRLAVTVRPAKASGQASETNLRLAKRLCRLYGVRV